MHQQLRAFSRQNHGPGIEHLLTFVSAVVVSGFCAFGLIALYMTVSTELESLLQRLSGGYGTLSEALRMLQLSGVFGVVLGGLAALTLIGCTGLSFYLANTYLNGMLQQHFRDSYYEAWKKLQFSSIAMLIADENYWGSLTQAPQQRRAGIRFAETRPRSICTQVEFCARHFDSLMDLEDGILTVEQLRQGTAPRNYSGNEVVAPFMFGCALLSCFPGVFIAGPVALLLCMVFGTIGAFNSLTLQMRCRRAAICDYFLGGPGTSQLNEWRCLLSERRNYPQRMRTIRTAQGSSQPENVAQLMRRIEEQQENS